MAKGKKKVETVFLVCDETGDYNYTLRRKSGGEKLKLQKYSPRLAPPHAAHRKEEISVAARPETEFSAFSRAAWPRIPRWLSRPAGIAERDPCARQPISPSFLRLRSILGRRRPLPLPRYRPGGYSVAAFAGNAGIVPERSIFSPGSLGCNVALTIARIKIRGVGTSDSQLGRTAQGKQRSEAVAFRRFRVLTREARLRQNPKCEGEVMEHNCFVRRAHVVGHDLVLGDARPLGWRRGCWPVAWSALPVPKTPIRGKVSAAMPCRPPVPTCRRRTSTTPRFSIGRWKTIDSSNR